MQNYVIKAAEKNPNADIAILQPIVNGVTNCYNE